MEIATSRFRIASHSGFWSAIDIQQ